MHIGTGEAVKGGMGIIRHLDFLVGWPMENGMMGLGILWMLHWPLFCLSSHMAVTSSNVTSSVHAFRRVFRNEA